MSFAGDLEHLPIVDVIQLLHSTRKTGTLCLKSHKGESQLVFNDGYIVGANHVNNSVRIGQILIEMNAITHEDLEKALALQKDAGEKRLPLIATLIESGLLKKEDAYTGLETLIEMTIVEVLTWSKGTFALDVHTTVVSDEYRYFPETLKQEIYLNTQSILMDALRIYDEKMRDGSLAEGAFSSDGDWSDTADSELITADDLGLGEIDSFEKSIPDVFGGLKDYDVSEIHRQKMRETVPDLPHAEHEKLLSFLLEIGSAPSPSEPKGDNSSLAVIIFSQDEWIKHIISTICRHENIFVVSTDEVENLDLIAEQTLSKELVPLLIIDAPDDGNALFSVENILGLLFQKLEKYPQLSILQLVCNRDYEFPLRALQAGARYVLSRPTPDKHKETFVEDTIKFAKALHGYIRKSANTSDHQVLRLFKESIYELGLLHEVPEVAFIPLRFASAMFERCLTLVVGNGELIAEKSFGIKFDKAGGASGPLLFRIPLVQPSVFLDAVQNGRVFYGQSSDGVLRSNLFEHIGAPYSSKILLMPIKNFGRVIALIYCDFGSKNATPVQIDLLDIIARHAGLVLDNNLYRKKYDKASETK